MTSTLQGDVIAGSVTVGALAFIAVLLRIKARRVQGVALAVDDYSTIAAVVSEAMLRYEISTKFTLSFFPGAL